MFQLVEITQINHFVKKVVKLSNKFHMNERSHTGLRFTNNLKDRRDPEAQAKQ